MNTVKDFTIGQRVATEQGNGEVTKIGRKYVYVLVDGAAKESQYLPEQLSEVVTPAEPHPNAEGFIALDESPSTTPTPSLVGNMIPDEAHVLFAPMLSNTAPTDGRPPMRIKGKRADADHRRAARKAQRKSRRANRR